MTRVLGNTELPDASRLLRVAADGGASPAAGQWYRLQGPDRDLELPVLDHSPAEGWLAFRAPSVTAAWGRGTGCRPAGPFGDTIPAAPAGRELVIIADTAGLPALLFACRNLAIHLALVGLGADPAPFRLRPSRYMVPGLAAGAIAGIGVLEDAGVASRIAHDEPLPGCREGPLASLVDEWLRSRAAQDRWQTAAVVVGTPTTLDALRDHLRGRVGEQHERPVPAAA
ncbi:hypothetical protein QWY84_00695 [Aquisalimonas lutea]|uniref:hypothetical protein n=1 Tax=Aquisalimonas lutea TaxID=1327750 RepID=UPI0025B466F4|nr:hypothetical protein [Aquisalimonas lutea]MDN3516115.1 hypothetical protein [Aquisalimonas lutea]